jgi:hypothetical protein
MVLTLLVICDDALGDGLADSIDLRGSSATLHANTNINLKYGDFFFFFIRDERRNNSSLAQVDYVRKFIRADEENRLKSLELENLGLKETDGDTVNLNQSSALLDKSQGGGGFLSVKCTN